jgi:hypothetical protein
MTHDLSPPLERLIQSEVPQLRALPDSTASVRPRGEGTWSPKEELGHLIDSAANNHIRFVRALIEPELHGPSYAQNDWVLVHRYQYLPWLDVVDFWFRYNLFLVPLLTRIPEEKLATPCFVGSGENVTLQFLVEDYVLHMQHHVDHLLGRERITAYPSAARLADC